MRLDGVWAQPSITIVALFVAMILAPCAVYFYVAHPDWSWLYLVDAGQVPRLAIVTIIAAYAGAVLGGYAGGVRILRAGRDKERLLLYALGGGALLLGVLVFLFRARLARYGSYAEFQSGTTLPLGDVKLGYVLVAVIVGVIAAAGIVGWELWRDGRRAAAR